ncbi:MAG TPA: CDP-alcohol phosphatidyltransferase family protein [Propionibacteriaceae bacterium]|nr:CDP-alcohol phosphatidyltransferase family protein [Propionibacteriaceae bacterium]
MHSVQTGPVVGLIGQLALLATLAATVGLGPAGWLIGAAVGLCVNATLLRGLHRAESTTLGPADRVTLVRATLVGGVAALTVDSFTRPAAVAAMVVMATVALVLDGLDGWVARRTGTASTLGARFDMEVDAFLILILSVYVAHVLGAWVLAAGAARYLFVAAGWLLPWMRRPLPARYWRKPVAAVQGIVLTAAVADILPDTVIVAAVLVALGLLAESFGRDVWWLWRHGRMHADRVFHAHESAPAPVD